MNLYFTTHNGWRDIQVVTERRRQTSKQEKRKKNSCYSSSKPPQVLLSFCVPASWLALSFAVLLSVFMPSITRIESRLFLGVSRGLSPPPPSSVSCSAFLSHFQWLVVWHSFWVCVSHLYHSHHLHHHHQEHTYDGSSSTSFWGAVVSRHSRRRCPPLYRCRMACLRRIGLPDEITHAPPKRNKFLFFFSLSLWTRHEIKAPCNHPQKGKSLFSHSYSLTTIWGGLLSALAFALASFLSFQRIRKHKKWKTPLAVDLFHPSCSCFLWLGYREWYIYHISRCQNYSWPAPRPFL